MFLDLAEVERMLATAREKHFYKTLSANDTITNA